MKDSRDYIVQEAAEQTAMKEEYQRQLKALPEGRLTVARKGTGAYYSKFQSGTKTYLGTAANEEVKSLQQRRILEASIQRIDSNLKLMDQYVRQYQPVDRMSVLQTLPKAYHNAEDLSQCGDEWERAPYDKSTQYPQWLTHQTLKGELVRTKSEALVANLLYNKGIPYHYEENLEFPEGVIAPDFKVAVRSENRFKLLEHCGLLGSDRYVRKFNWKLQTYIRNGYIPWRDVFFTFDDLNGSIDTRAISQMMDNYFL